MFMRTSWQNEIYLKRSFSILHFSKLIMMQNSFSQTPFLLLLLLFSSKANIFPVFYFNAKCIEMLFMLLAFMLDDFENQILMFCIHFACILFPKLTENHIPYILNNT